MNKNTPHQHGHKADADSDDGSHKGHEKASADHSGHDQHEGHSPKMFRDKFWLSLALTVPVVFWSAHIQELLGYRAPVFTGSEWIPPVLGTAVFLYGGLVFLQGAWRELRARLPGMMTLISLAIAVAFVFSWVVQSGLLAADALWWELATLVTIMLLRPLDRNALDHAGPGRPSGVGEASPGHRDTRYGRGRGSSSRE